MAQNPLEDVDVYVNGLLQQPGEDYHISNVGGAQVTGNVPQGYSKPDFTEHPSCEDCHHALECMAGAIPNALTKVSEKTAPTASKYFLPCVDNGKLLLTPSLSSWAYTDTDATIHLPSAPQSGDTIIIKAYDDVPQKPVTIQTTFVKAITPPPKTTWKLKDRECIQLVSANGEWEEVS